MYRSITELGCRGAGRGGALGGLGRAWRTLSPLGDKWAGVVRLAEGVKGRGVVCEMRMRVVLR